MVNNAINNRRRKIALLVLGLDPKQRYISGIILEKFLKNKDPSRKIDEAFATLYYNLNPKQGLPRTDKMVKAAIKERHEKINVENI